ncbi:2-amino-4-hydroxy-6-hydroxymethyldihydropteridine diphosphokinase [Rathayibacter toxicus]|uniref:2-amino-4-hydroxy-6-hydroxymethyldihydropteridine diphosphokinase n=2 Tax=Rathayibacter toxicus TaxID=145458 RepID=A0A2S5Y4J2_9MICO|nr:2-amino-4-hydroxy-6-hydroxymethyldihydropteridine diphosphokinase [Rathayibacter toxicus]PPG45945.1 2-amino-4-hydroxy-6-hydroxymethyldihydropteridine diphosphokinase [Rathayibacter toxicus]PPH21234.1 2-amino-4-hydroxy-6-hydroxymethyldihydropteridine diphosphokinase [Rathayibacter toxicus]PPH56318.1 2-amino-4-hydroxy-6-hydroxymethyldihydropteridine diphosphokinase [Rathayibacter toxicus]PPH58516.1 2-amino-4-hydroxy-6-hydroxymethyldihydropteridine diphosphokinase [Rathayibacter toxicus]
MVLALGSNLGDRLAQLEEAVRALASTPGLRLEAVSKLIESPAWTPEGVDEDAPAYLNVVVTGSTSLEPEELLAVTSAIEFAGGRRRGEGEQRWGARTLDIDVIVIGGVRRDDPRLTLPHPRAAERAFVLDPWLDIEPAAVLPGVGPVAGLRARAMDPVTDRPEAIAWQNAPTTNLPTRVAPDRTDSESSIP